MQTDAGKEYEETVITRLLQKFAGYDYFWDKDGLGNRTILTKDTISDVDDWHNKRTYLVDMIEKEGYGY